MVSNIPSTSPTQNSPAQNSPKQNNDGTISAQVLECRAFVTGGAILRVWLPVEHDAGGDFGRYFLARCVEDTPRSRAGEWSIYARRPLFCAAVPTAQLDNNGSIWELLIPGTADAGHQWLLHRPVGTTINLLGPYGQRFALALQTRALLIIADTDHLPVVLPLIHTMLDSGGRIVLVIKGDATLINSWLPMIPIPVETSVVSDAEWFTHLEQPVRWADQVCAALPASDYPQLAHALRTIRFRLDADFCHVLYPGDLTCGVGACLACVVPTREGGYTRACIHGPVFPLASLF